MTSYFFLISNLRKFIRRFLFLLCCMLLFISNVIAHDVNSENNNSMFIWNEGEVTASNAPEIRPDWIVSSDLFSGGHFLQIIIPSEELKKLKDKSVSLNYNISAPNMGKYQVWARVGFEYARSPIEWRIADENSPWVGVPAGRHTINPTLGPNSTPIGWLLLGEVSKLPAENCQLQIRIREPSADGTLRFGMDCFVLVAPKENFHPEGILKPNQTYDRPIDKAAFTNEFIMPEVPMGERSSIQLSGLWQVARYDDPNMDVRPHEPIRQVPKLEDLHWQGITVPSSAWNTQPLVFGHRLLYRTHVRIPESATVSGRSFFFHFAGTNWIVSVFVNGTLMGTHKGVLVPWDLDVSKGLRAGSNEVILAVKGSWYAHDAHARGLSLEYLRTTLNTPEALRQSRWIAPIWPSLKGEGNGVDYGIVDTVTLLSTGAIYVDDVFVRPSVLKHSLDADITLRANGTSPRLISLQCEAISERTGEVEHVFPTVDTNVQAGQEYIIKVGDAWRNPKLWWPVAQPDMYRMRVTILEQGQVLDVYEQKFGFREITVDGTKIRLNGTVRNFWNWVGVSGSPQNTNEWLVRFREEGNRFYRFGRDSDISRFFPNRAAELDFFDQNGIPGRLSTCIDGMMINYDLLNPLVWANFREHIDQVTRAYRNHPSIMLYSLENEILYITAHNIFSNSLDMIESEFSGLVNIARQNDPMIPCITDGGGALKNASLPVSCLHYPEPATANFQPDPRYFPDNLYSLKKVSDHSARWLWDHKSPLIIGETFFYAGKQEDQAWIGGDSVFQNRASADIAATQYVSRLIEGYRWAGVAGICPWVPLDRVAGARSTFSDLAVFTRRSALRFRAGSQGDILVKVLNDTLSDAPIRFSWQIQIGGKKRVGGSELLHIVPGNGQERTLRFTLPITEKRQEGVLILNAQQVGTSATFETTKSISIFPLLGRLILPKSTPIYVYEQGTTLATYLTIHGITAMSLSSLSGITNKRSGVLIIGSDILKAEEVRTPILRRFAERGGRVIVLEQTVPLRGAAIPVGMEPIPNSGGSIAFSQALGLPIFNGLQKNDFIEWNNGGATYRVAYNPSKSGGRNLVSCGSGLRETVLTELPCGDGVIILSQLCIGTSIEKEPVAEQLLVNLVNYVANYRVETGTVAVLTSGSDELIHKTLDKIGVPFSVINDLKIALSDPKRYRVLIVKASPPVLDSLAQSKQVLDTYVTNGGWVMLWGLEPKGLPVFNRLVGKEHSIRPFRVERVTLKTPEHPLVATIGNRDLTFYGKREIMHGDLFRSQSLFSYVIDAGENIAPFTRPTGATEDQFIYQPTYSHDDPFALVDGLVNADSWRYTYKMWVNPNGPAPLEFNFYKPEMLRAIRLWNNVNYWSIKDLDIIFDGDQGRAIHVVLPANGRMVDILLATSQRVSKSITLIPRTWREDNTANTQPGIRLVGLDEVEFLRVPSPESESPIPFDSAGGLVAYPRGKGGLILNQVNISGLDDLPDAEERKRHLIATLVQNLGVRLGTSKTISSIKLVVPNVLQVGQSIQLETEMIMADGTIVPLGKEVQKTFTVANNAIAKLDKQGVVTASTLGQTLVSMRTIIDGKEYIASANLCVLGGKQIEHNTKPQVRPENGIWKIAQIGPSTRGGASIPTNDSLLIASNGRDVYFGADEYTYVFQPITVTVKDTSLQNKLGKGSVTATIESVSPAGPYAAAGLMLRDGYKEDANHANLRVNAKGELVLVYRSSDFPSSNVLPFGKITLPATLRLEWRDTMLIASRKEGNQWHVLGQVTAPFTQDTRLTAGLAVYSNDNEQFCMSRFTDIVIR
jgi:hypothetical protein